MCEKTCLTSRCTRRHPSKMEGNFLVFVLLFGTAAVMGKPTQEDGAGSCDVNPSNRFECGWLGITEETCLARNCCWDDSDSWAKFCFVKKYEHLPDGLCPYQTLSGASSSQWRSRRWGAISTMVYLAPANTCVIRARRKHTEKGSARDESAVTKATPTSDKC
ncbi:hypothetical protein ACROYT_G039915 [Oculina patagonica]